MDFRRAVQVLCDGGVEFVIVGVVAASLHGSVRISIDLDICYRRSTVNVKRLADVLKPLRPRPIGFPENLPFTWDEKTLRNATVLTLQTELGEIDLLAEVAGIGSFEEVQAVEAFERKVQTIDLRALIQAKRTAGREKDLSALPELEGLAEAADNESGE